MLSISNLKNGDAVNNKHINDLFTLSQYTLAVAIQKRKKIKCVKFEQ